MCLVLGPQGAGKTLLLKRLSFCSNRGSFSNVGEMPSTIPTVGTELITIGNSRKAEITLRELGGCMAPIWYNYYKGVTGVMFVVDVANRTQVSASTMLLYDVLTHADLQTAAVLVVLNKGDLPNAMPRWELDDYMFLDRVVKDAKQKVTVIETSASTGKNLADIAKWIQNNIKPLQL